MAIIKLNNIDIKSKIEVKKLAKDGMKKSFKESS